MIRLPRLHNNAALRAYYLAAFTERNFKRVPVQPTYETVTILRLSFLLVFGFCVFSLDFVYGLSADSDILI